MVPTDKSATLFTQAFALSRELDPLRVKGLGLAARVAEAAPRQAHLAASRRVLEERSRKLPDGTLSLLLPE